MNNLYTSLLPMRHTNFGTIKDLIIPDMHYGYVQPF